MALDLPALADFNAVAAHGGFGAAARATGRPKATLSRRVRELEDALGVRLIDRGARPFHLTEEGAALHEETRVMLDRIDEVAAGLASLASAPRGRLRVSAPVLFAHRGLGRLAARFARKYPDVQLEVVVDDRFVDPLKEGFDIVIRANPKPTTELAGRCFLRDRLVVAAPPSLERPPHGGSFPAILLPAAGEDTEWQIVDKGLSMMLHAREVLRVSSMAMVLDAVLEGAGAAMVPASLIRTHVAESRLANWGDVAGRTTEVWALYPPQRHIAAKISAFITLLTEHFQDASPRFFDNL
jgi:DNA-binding transcriptional LysR family regulator